MQDHLENDSVNSNGHGRDESPDKQFGLSGEAINDFGAEMNQSVLLNSRNYPFYYRVKRDLYVTQQLLQAADAKNSGLEDDQDQSDKIGRGKSSSSVKITCFEDDNESLNWSFRNNITAETFRRSMLPFYLLK